MSLLGRIDHWLGSRLFVPPIIRLCQLTGASQYKVANYAMFIGFMVIVGSGPDPMGWILYTILCVVVVLNIVIIALDPDKAGRPRGWWRLIAWGFMISSLISVITFDHGWDALSFWLLNLIAEYALTIKTIPPAPTKEARHTKLETQ